MALQDQIIIQSDVDPKSTLQLLVGRMGITDDPYDVKSHPLMPVVGIKGEIWEAHANEMKDPYQSLVNEAVGFSSNVDIAIFLNKREFRTARLEWFEAVLDVLGKTQWNLALLHGDSDVVLLRKSGKLTLRKGDHFWTPERLEMIRMPYAMDDLPNL